MTDRFEKLAATATFSIIVHPEDIPVRGNAIASGDDEVDKAAEDAIIAELEWNEWAWCCVEVRAELDEFSGSAFLGSCSYASEEDFKQDCVYFPQLCDEARDDLAQALRSAAEALKL